MPLMNEQITKSLTKMFEAFVTTKSEGMGLGLAISKSIAEAHGGSLTVTPNAAAGVTFCLTLPVEDDSTALDG